MTDEIKKCPLCAEEIKAEARICRFCGARFEVSVRGYCAACHAIRAADENSRCRTCGREVMDLHADSKLIDGGIQSSPGPAAVSPLVVPVPVVSAPSAAAPSVNPGENWSRAGKSTAYPVPQHRKIWLSLLQLYFSPNGRIGRPTFFLKGLLPIYVGFGVCTAIMVSISNPNEVSSQSSFFLGVFALLLLVLFWILLMLIVKRFHDLDRSGWSILFWLIPLLGQFIYFANLIQLFFFKGTGPNRYGENSR